VEIEIGKDKFQLNQKLYSSHLMQHQVVALHWLLQQHSHKRGSILADEMGLGKTISTIALLATLYTTARETEQRLGPTLVVCPATMVNQWKSELQLWTGGLYHPTLIRVFTSLPAELD